MQCVRMWFGNYASGHCKGERLTKAKNDIRSHPTSSRSWTAKSVCGHHFVDCVSDKHKRLSNSAEKDIGKYHAALAAVFNELTGAELKRCEDDAIEWNTKPLPDEIQQKCDPVYFYLNRLLITSKAILENPYRSHGFPQIHEKSHRRFVYCVWSVHE